MSRGASERSSSLGGRPLAKQGRHGNERLHLISRGRYIHYGATHHRPPQPRRIGQSVGDGERRIIILIVSMYPRSMSTIMRRPRPSRVCDCPHRTRRSLHGCTVHTVLLNSMLSADR